MIKNEFVGQARESWTLSCVVLCCKSVHDFYVPLLSCTHFIFFINFTRVTVLDVIRIVMFEFSAVPQ